MALQGILRALGKASNRSESQKLRAAAAAAVETLERRVMLTANLEAFSDDFEGGLKSNWSGGQIEAINGPNHVLAAASSPVTLQLGKLPQHDDLFFGYTVYAFNEWQNAAFTAQPDEPGWNHLVAANRRFQHQLLEQLG